MQAASLFNDVQSTLPSGVVKVIHQYSAEYPDDPRVIRTIHVLTNGEEKVVFEDQQLKL
jgi:hypothetical protein